MISDEVLMLAFQQGSREAFDELYARFKGPLYGFFRRRLDSDLRAEDLTQEAFVVLIRDAAKYQPRALLRTYLYSIALRLLLAERRNQKRDASDTTTLDSLAAPENYARERELWVREGLEKLDDTEREILMLREYEQLSYSEIAELLKLPVNTVRSRLFRARIALKAHLSPEAKTARAAVADGSDDTPVADVIKSIDALDSADVGDSHSHSSERRPQ